MQHEIRQIVRGLRRALLSVVVAIGVVGVLVSAASGAKASTRGSAALDEGDARVEAELVIEASSAVAGATFRIGVLLRMDPGWHVYWKNSGDSGFPTEVEWNSPDVSFGPLRYPAPHVFVESGGLATTYGYANEVLLFSEASISPDAYGPIRVEATVRFLVCKIRCIPGEIQLDTILPAGPGGLRSDGETSAVFDQFAARVPVSPEELGIVVEANYSVEAVQAGEMFELGIAVAPCELDSARCPTIVGFAAAPGEFAIDAGETLDLDRVGVLAHPKSSHGVLLVTRGHVLKGQAVPGTIGGVLALEIDGRPQSVVISLAIPRESQHSNIGPPVTLEVAPSSQLSDQTGPSIWLALGFGLLGGLILNLMPCVLPVLALKAFRIVEAGAGDQRELRHQGAAFTFGVLVSMAVLAAVVLGLRSAGEAVGWGFQFQHPVFLAFMGALLTVFALNLFGVFEITLAPNGLAAVGAQSGATVRSFFDGGLAVLLATPCSAPFLGSAVGFAFAGNSITVVVIFLAIGLGLALPYLVMSFVPGLASRLPRPGAWMADLQILLGFSLLATVVWLLWIAGQSTGPDGVIWLVSFLLVLALMVWILGTLQNREHRTATRVAVVSLAIFTAVGIARIPLDTIDSKTLYREQDIREWNAAEVRRAVESGKPVFVNFDADWCLSCKVNERLVLSTEEVESAMSELGVVRFRGDWTLRDDAILAELQRHGRAGVPLYLVYRAGSPDDPEVLSEILTIDQLIAALRRASRV